MKICINDEPVLYYDEDVRLSSYRHRRFNISGWGAHFWYFCVGDSHFRPSTPPAPQKIAGFFLSLLQKAIGTLDDSADVFIRIHSPLLDAGVCEKLENLKLPKDFRLICNMDKGWLDIVGSKGDGHLMPRMLNLALLSEKKQKTELARQQDLDDLNRRLTELGITHILQWTEILRQEELAKKKKRVEGRSGR